MVRMTYSSQQRGGRYFVGQEASTRVFREHITPREQPTMISTYEFLATWMRARFADSERGASLVEYALLVALIAVVCIVAVQILGRKANSSFSSTGSAIAN